MDSPLIYLTVCTMRNRLRVRLNRLREPRYLIGSIVGLAYFAMVFGRPFTRRSQRGPTGALALIGHSETAVLLTAAGLLLILAFAWLWPRTRRPALAFTRADVQFLFTAPIERWRLVRYKVLRSQLAAFFGSAIVTLFTRPGSFAQAWTFLVGFALIMGIVNVHLTGVSLTRVPVETPGSRIVRRWVPATIVAMAVAVVIGDITMRWSALTAAFADGGMTETARLLSTGSSGVVLWPLMMLVRLPLADSASAFAIVLPWALLVLGLNYAWLLRLDVPFEEGSAEMSEKIARVRTEGFSALRDRPRRPVTTTPFRLAPEGPLETAILWKNLISMGRFFSWTTLMRFVPLLFVFLAVTARGGRGSASRADALALVSLMIVGIVVWVGPQIARADLRQDLPNLAILRTWPLRGATLVRGEVLAPAIVLVTFAWLALVAAAFFSSQGTARVQIPDRWAFLIAAMAVAPGVILVQLLVQNALAVTFPSWIATGPPRGGVDVMGQRMVLMFGSLIAIVIAVLPAGIVAAIVILAVRAVTGSYPIVVPGLVAAGVLLGEAFAGSELVGWILDRTDVNALDPSGA